MAESVPRAASASRLSAAPPRPAALLRNLAGERLAPVTLFAAALGIGIIVRLAALGLGDGFPLNDGGMFFVMVEDIKAAGYALPEHTSYGGGDIPFAYPPLPFYLAAALSDAGGWQTQELLRALPLLFSVLTIPAFWLLSRALLEKPLLAGLATLLFVSMPRSFNWEVVGGGLTRSPGLFFATLALWQAVELFRDGNRRRLAPAVAFSALTVLCHLEMGWFLAFSTLFFALWHRRQTDTFVNAALLASGVAVLTAPWYGAVLAQHGPGPMLAALQTGGHSPAVLLAPLLLRFTDDAWFPLALTLAMLGLLASLRDRRYLLPAWLLLIFVLDPRKAATVSTLPLAMLAATGLAAVVWPLMRREGRKAPAWAFAASGFLLLVYAPATALVSANGPDSPLYAISEPQRQAMAWAREQTPQVATFIVVPSANRWANDAPSEWFPALAQRRSLNTVQGSEWLAGGAYDHASAAFKAVADCAGKDVACLETWRAGYGLDYTHVFVPKGESAAGRTLFSRQTVDCCARLLESLRSAAGYRLIFENEGAAIFERL